MFGLKCYLELFFNIKTGCQSEGRRSGHQWQLLLLLLCAHAGIERCSIAACQVLQLENALVFLKQKENYADPGEGRKQMGCHF